VLFESLEVNRLYSHSVFSEFNIVTDRQRQTKYTVRNDMAREVPMAVVLHRSTLRPHKCKPTEFYPHRQTPSHPIIMHKFLGLWDTSNFCFMYSYVIAAT